MARMSRTNRSIGKEMPERLERSLSGGPFGSKHLPWDVFNILSADTLPPAVGGLASASVYEKGAAASTRRAAGTNGTVRIRNA